jgi:hypothetical protein
MPCSRHASTDAAFMTALLVQILRTMAASVADMTEAQRLLHGGEVEA